MAFRRIVFIVYLILTLNSTSEKKRAAHKVLRISAWRQQRLAFPYPYEYYCSWVWPRCSLYWVSTW